MAANASLRASCKALGVRAAALRSWLLSLLQAD